MPKGSNPYSGQEKTTTKRHNLKPDSLRERSATLKPLSTRMERAEEELRRFFANSIGMLCIAGFDGYIKRLNPAWKNTLGWTPKELQARPLIEFVHPDDQAATLAQVKNVTRGGRTILFENRYRCRDGSYRWLEWNANSIRGRRQIYAIASDVTLRKGLEKEVLESSDREKERLGRELHDGLCQNLAGIAALSSTLSKKLAAAGSPAAVEASEIAKLLNGAIGQARDLARGLDPVGLEEIGLAAAIEAFAANVRGLFRISCRFQCNRHLLRLGHEVETHLYRITQEAVNNAITHGRGRRIEISLRFRNRRGLLSIRDDGVGISKKSLAGKTIGMHSMDYRSRVIGGSLHVQRLNRRGTEVNCAFRLPPEPAKDRHHARKKN